jgi:hypothetical protein
MRKKKGEGGSYLPAEPGREATRRQGETPWIRWGVTHYRDGEQQMGAEACMLKPGGKIQERIEKEWCFGGESTV